MTTKNKKKLIKISELAKKAGVLISTIDFYVRQDLLKPVSFSQGNYRLFNKRESLKRLKKIKELQKNERLTIKEIVKHFKTKKYEKRCSSIQKVKTRS